MLLCHLGIAETLRCTIISQEILLLLFNVANNTSVTEEVKARIWVKGQESDE